MHISYRYVLQFVETNYKQVHIANFFLEQAKPISWKCFVKVFPRPSPAVGRNGKYQSYNNPSGKCYYSRLQTEQQAETIVRTRRTAHGPINVGCLGFRRPVLAESNRFIINVCVDHVSYAAAAVPGRPSFRTIIGPLEDPTDTQRRFISDGQAAYTRARYVLRTQKRSDSRGATKTINNQRIQYF